MAITASQVGTANTLEQFRVQFNNLQTDVSGLEAGTISYTALSATTISVSELTVTSSLTAESFIFEGDTDDDFETTLTVTDPTADRTITFPNVTGTVTLDGNPVSSDGSSLGTTSLEWSDLYLADGAVLGFGDDQDVTLTHIEDAGLLLNSTNYLTFRDSALKIYSSADGQLDIDADTEIEITATTVDLNGNLEVSGDLTVTGNLIGDIEITGTTPKLTIGDAGTEDSTLLFDGNAQDYYIALDDSADDLLIGLGSTVGTTPAIAIDENLLATFHGGITMAGTTPTLTIGDAGAEDTKIVFDGNAQDFYIGLDDSADDLLIGLGSTVGTTPAISIDENLKVTLAGDLVVSGDDITMGTNTSGAALIADGTNFNPVVISGDATIATNGALTIASTAIESGMLNANIISGQTEITSVDLTNDDLLILDATDGALKKVATTNLGFSTDDPTALAIALG